MFRKQFSTFWKGLSQTQECKNRLNETRDLWKNTLMGKHWETYVTSGRHKKPSQEISFEKRRFRESCNIFFNSSNTNHEETETHQNETLKLIKYILSLNFPIHLINLSEYMLNHKRTMLKVISSR